MSELQVTWFLLIGVLLGGYAILDGFDLGVGCWHLFAKSDGERRTFFNAIGPVWDGNEVWLLTGGGALFAAFPPVYASVFSGFYLALMLVLLGLILRAVSIEFRSKLETPGWRAAWDRAFAVGSILPALLFGVALGNLVRGLPLNESGDYIGGFFALLNPYSLVVGVAGLSMLAMHGALYLAVKTEGDLQERARGWASKAWAAYLVLFLVSSSWSVAAYARGGWMLPAVAGLVALAAILAVRFYSRAGADAKAFLASAVGIAAVFGGTGATMFPNLVPASNRAELSLTIFNSSASQNTLTIMLIIALIGMPMVLAYTIYIYRTFAGTVGPESAHEGY
jgi:cytochrome d ubiquinol oxidase subunit II